MNELHQLIKSMSKSEKRYFRLFAASICKEEIGSIALFDELAKMEVYEENLLESVINTKESSEVKEYLFDCILKALRLYYTEKNQYYQILDAFKNIAIIRDKGLIKEAVKVYEKTEKQLLDLKLFPFLVELLNIGEVLYRVHLSNKEADAKIKEIEAKKLKYINLHEKRVLSREIEF